MSKIEGLVVDRRNKKLKIFPTETNETTYEEEKPVFSAEKVKNFHSITVIDLKKKQNDRTSRIHD